MGVFVSYSSRDKDAVARLTQDLQDAEQQVWLDQRLAGGDAWWRAILDQIRGCDAFIFALSQNSIQSKPCQAELHYAQDLGLPILPVQVGYVDSMQLNPLATVQTVDYRTSTSTAGMRLLSALHRAKTQRQPLPSPLPPEPEVPFEYLIRLYTTIAGTDQLSPRDQAALVTQLEFGLREDGDHEAARKDIIMLLTKLRDREDVTYRTRTDVDAILASIDAEARPEAGTQPPDRVAAITHTVWPSSTSTLGAPPTEPEDTATTHTTEALVDTPPPNTTTAEKMTVVQRKSQRQTETTRVPEGPPSPFGRRSTAILVGMLVTAVVLIGAGVTPIAAGNVVIQGICFDIAAALITGVVLVRLKAASERRGTQILVGMAVTAVIVIAVAVTLIIVGIHTRHAYFYEGISYPYFVGGSVCIVIAAALLVAIVVMHFHSGDAGSTQSGFRGIARSRDQSGLHQRPSQTE